METPEEIHERIYNPSPAVTHCPCGEVLESCVDVIARGGCSFSNRGHYSEFLKMTPEWYVRAIADLA